VSRPASLKTVGGFFSFMAISIVRNIDCMVGMKEYPDKFFDLAIVDPPYGIGASMFGSYGTVKKRFTAYKKKDWDNKCS
jgi:site-specific DNA-methyltransferase (adenine-specific)